MDHGSVIGISQGAAGAAGAIVGDIANAPRSGEGVHVITRRTSGGVQPGGAVGLGQRIAPKKTA